MLGNPTLLRDFVNAKQLGPFDTFTRSTADVRTNKDGVLVPVGTGSPVFDYDPVSGLCRGYRGQTASTNLMLQSGVLDNASWNKAQATVTANARTGPDGTTAMDKVVETAVSNFHYIYQSHPLADNTVYCASIYAAAAERNWMAIECGDKNGASHLAYFDLAAGAVGNMTAGTTAGLTPVGNGIFRCWISFNSVTGAVNPYTDFELAQSSSVRLYLGDGVSGLYLWGAQLEIGSVPSSYVSTTTTSVSRTTDLLTIPTTAGGWFNPTEGCFLIQCNYQGGASLNPGARAALQLTVADGSGTAVLCNRSGQAGGIDASGVSGEFIYVAGPTDDSITRTAFAYSATVLKGCCTGNAVGTLTSANFVSTVQAIHVGNTLDATLAIGGWVQRLVYWPVFPSDADLQAITN